MFLSNDVLSNHVNNLFQKVEPPLVDWKNAGEYEQFSEGFVHLAKTLTRSCLPRQAIDAITVDKSLTENGFAFLNGQPGIGKTQIANSVVSLIQKAKDKKQKEGTKILFFSDGSKLIKKMVKESKAVLGGDKVKVMIIRNKNDLRYSVEYKVEPGKMVYFIISKDKAKGNYSKKIIDLKPELMNEEAYENYIQYNKEVEKEFRVIKNPAKFFRFKRCPGCGKRVMMKKEFDKVSELVKSDESETVGYNAFTYMHRNNRTCASCDQKMDKPDSKNQIVKNGKLQSMTVKYSKKRGISPKTSFGHTLRKMMSKMSRHQRNKIYDMIIFDEAHNYKSDDSLQGQVFRDFVPASQKVLLMTGTLTNGYASSLFFLLYALMPKKMKEWGFDINNNGLSKFIDAYGARKFITFRKANGSTRTKIAEIPVINYSLVLDHLAPYTVWTTMEDLNYPMPRYIETPISVPLEKEVEEAIKIAKEEAKNVIQEKELKNARVLTQAMLYIPNNPTKPYEITQNEGETEHFLAEIKPIFPEDYVTNKERKLIDLIEKEFAEGRKSMVYTLYNNTSCTTDRLERVLGRALDGIRVKSLPSSTPSDKIEDWIEVMGDEADVILVPYKRVATGLDIIEFPTNIFYEEGQIIVEIQQASKRSYRAVKQKQEVRVYHLYYEGAQAVNLELISKKIVATKVVDGKVLTAEGIEALTTDSIQIELEKKLLEQTDELFQPELSSTEIPAGKIRPWTYWEQQYLNAVIEHKPENVLDLLGEEGAKEIGFDWEEYQKEQLDLTADEIPQEEKTIKDTEDTVTVSLIENDITGVEIEVQPSSDIESNTIVIDTKEEKTKNVSTKETKSSDATEQPIKRKRGRPRKNPAPKKEFVHGTIDGCEIVSSGNYNTSDVFVLEKKQGKIVEVPVKGSIEELLNEFASNKEDFSGIQLTFSF